MKCCRWKRRARAKWHKPKTLTRAQHSALHLCVRVAKMKKLFAEWKTHIFFHAFRFSALSNCPAPVAPVDVRSIFMDNKINWILSFVRFVRNEFSEENTETPAEWILIPSVLPATTFPSILVASPITGIITKRPLPTVTVSSVKNQTTPFAQTTASRPKPVTRPPPPLEQGILFPLSPNSSMAESND